MSKDKELFSAICDPEEVGNLATGLLSAAHGSARLVGQQVPSQEGNIPLNAAIPVTNWHFGDTNVQGQKAVIVEVGRTKIGFIVQHEQMRAFGRTIVGASWKTGKVQASLVQLMGEFGAELRFWFSVNLLRRVAAIQIRISELVNWIGGRTFNPFFATHIAPGMTTPRYQPVGECIYCGSTVYSSKPSVREYPLGAEHIVAEGLGGSIELPDASCQECEEATGAVVEGDVLGRTMKALRVHLRLRKSGSGPPPKTLPLQATIFGEEKTIQMPIEDYPILFAMFAYAPPNIDAADGMPMVTSASIVRIKHDERLLFQKYGIGAFATPYLDNVMMCRMLAKIGHALAAAELGKEKFDPLLVDLIRVGADRRSMRFVGGTTRSVKMPSNTLHYLALGFQKIKGTTYVVAHIRLFASQGGPTYAVVVGQSRESPIGRFKRTFLGKISQTFFR